MLVLSFPTSVFAAAPQTVFAKVYNSNIFFYNSPINDDAYKLFEIPKTYYVELLANADDTDDVFFAARYIDVLGYVKKSDVQPVQGTPLQPFASNVNFRVFAPSGLDLKSTPLSNSPFNRIVNVPYLCTNLIFYGTLEGDQMIPEKSCTWFYCKYISGTSTYQGFLYSDLCDKLTPIPENTEILQPFEGELFQKTPPLTAPSDAPHLSPTLKVLLIIFISIPCLFIVYLIFKPTHLVADNGQKSKKKIHKIRRSDYYELED